MNGAHLYINSARCQCMLPVYAHMNGGFHVVYRLPEHVRI